MPNASSSYQGNVLSTNIQREGVDLGPGSNVLGDLAKLASVRPAPQQASGQPRARGGRAGGRPMKEQMMASRAGTPTRQYAPPAPLTYVQPGLASLRGGGGIHEDMGYIALKPGEKIPYAAGTGRGTPGTGGSGLGSSDLSAMRFNEKPPKDTGDERADFFGTGTTSAMDQQRIMAERGRQRMMAQQQAAALAGATTQQGP